MSEIIRKGTGIALILTSIMLCMIPVLCQRSAWNEFYQTGGRTEQHITMVPTERNGPVAVNDAEAEELTILPGIGETLSRLMIEERCDNGPYYYAEDLETVKGIGPSTLNRIRDLIDLAQTESGE